MERLSPLCVCVCVFLVSWLSFRLSSIYFACSLCFPWARADHRNGLKDGEFVSDSALDTFRIVFARRQMQVSRLETSRGGGSNLSKLEGVKNFGEHDTTGKR